eukprot:Nk52_evm42s2391 gene=Nk52_evmTU42s2391
MTTGFVINSTRCFFYGFVLHYLITKEGHLIEDGKFIGEGEYENRTSSDIAIWWQAYIYFGVAISEIWTCISLLEFSFSQTPKSLNSVVMATTNMTTALGSLLGIVLKPLFIPSNVIYLFPILGSIQFVLAPFFYFTFRNYKPISANDTMAVVDDPLSSSESSLEELTAWNNFPYQRTEVE